MFDSSESINACPKLRDRPGGPCAAVCVPVTVATRPVGVLHMTGPELVAPDVQVTDRLVTLSVQVGNRLGALRTLESTRKEASTDGLTGLPNRRMLESEVATLIERGTPFVMVLADLDKFKKLNDNFGHEIGDKALQLFAGVLRDNVRGNDVVSRLGGEEFVLVYPNMSVEISIEAIGRLRQALARAIAASRLPSFTCSFGVTHSEVGGDGDGSSASPTPVCCAPRSSVATRPCSPTRSSRRRSSRTSHRRRSRSSTPTTTPTAEVRPR